MPDRQQMVDKCSYADGDSCHYYLQNFPHAWLLDSAQRNWGNRMHLETLGPFSGIWREGVICVSRGDAVLTQGSVVPIYDKSLHYV